jgi:hypothetical protein
MAESFASDCRVANRGKSYPPKIQFDSPNDLGSSIPPLAALPRHGDAGGIAHLDPDRARTGSLGAVDLLGDDPLGTKPASVLEHRRAIPGDMFVEHDARLGVAQQSRQRGLAIDKWAIAEKARARLSRR